MPWIEDPKSQTRFRQVKGHGRELPVHLKTNLEECRRGKRICQMATGDQHLEIAWNNRDNRFEVWGPSLSNKGWEMICPVCNDAGQAWHSPVPWDMIGQSLWRALNQPANPEAIMAQLEAESQSRNEERSRIAKEKLRYLGRAIEGGVNGWGRWDSEREMTDALVAADEGRTRARPYGQRTFIPKVVKVGW